MATLGRILLVVFLALVVTATAVAQYPASATLNVAVADRVGEQVTPKVACTPDGGCYVGWFDHYSSQYQLWLQRLDAAGVEAWPHNGLLVSNHPQDSWLVDWDLIADSAGNAVLTFADIRAGGDLDVYAYRIDPAGTFLWGANGVTLSNDAEFEPAPRVTETSDGDFVFVWSRWPNVGDGKIVMQRLSAGGQPKLAAGGVAVAGAAGESPGFCSVVAADSGSVVVSWVRDVSTLYSQRHLRAEKFSSTGASLWGGPRSVFDKTSMPIAHDPELVADQSGGALLAWHYSDPVMFKSAVQHLDAAGTELFPHDGVSLSRLATNHHIDPVMVYDPACGDILVFWNERDSNQGQRGICGQMVSAAGACLWGLNGIEFVTVDNVIESSPRAVAYGGGAMVFFTQEILGSPNQEIVLGLRVDGFGKQVWGGPVGISTVPSHKTRLPVAGAPSGQTVLVWEDNRAGNIDVFAQNIHPGGNLGPAALVADSDVVSLSAGGTQNLALAAGTGHALRPYVMLGSASGIVPGINFGTAVLPLNYDVYLLTTYVHPTFPAFTGFVGALNGSGGGTAAITVPPGSAAVLAGYTLFHAFVVLSPLGDVIYASNATSLTLAP